MQLSDFLGKKLMDIGTDVDTDTLFFVFTGGHQIHVRRSDIERTIICVKANESSDELETRRQEIKKARAEAKAAKVAKATNAPAPKKATKRTSKKKTDS